MASGLDISSNMAGNKEVNLKYGQVISPTNLAIFQTFTTLRTYLLTQGYTNATLDPMTKNDMIFAARKKMGIPYLV